MRIKLPRTECFVPGGSVVLVNLFDPNEVRFVMKDYPRAALTVADPPYGGGIVSEGWDQVTGQDLAIHLSVLFRYLSKKMLPGSHLCLWGGFGTPGHRALFRTIIELEASSLWQMAAFNTWQKKRAYGTKWRCLAAREEMVRFVLGEIKKPRVYNVQHTDKLRGYAGFNKKHPAKSEYKRMTMIWDHASDMGQNKPHKCHKPAPLAQTLVNMCTNRGDLIFDLFAGSGEVSLQARELDRPFVAFEGCPEEFEKLVERLR